MKHYKCLFFDLDDTLLDFNKAEVYAFDKLMQQNGIPNTSEIFKSYDVMNKRVWADYEKRLLTADEVKVRRFELFCLAYQLPLIPAALSEQYLDNLSQNHEFMDGAPALMDSIQGRFHLVLVTNGLSKVQNPRISNSGLGTIFSQTYISEEVGLSKPSTEFFQYVFDRLTGIKKEDILMIGDSLSSDMLGGINFGLDTCWYNPKGFDGSLPVTFQVNHLSDLQKLLG